MKFQKGAFKSPFIKYITIRNHLQMSFNRYQIPPNFDICQLHQKAALIYGEISPDLKRCPCCQRAVGITSMPFCRSSDKLLKISEQLPLYFSFIKAIMFIIVTFSFVLLGQYMFSRNYQQLFFQLQLPNMDMIRLQIGFIEKTRAARFCTFLIFSSLILIARAYLKKKKYEAAFITNRLSDRSVMFTNVHPRVSIADIREKFQNESIQNIVLTFRVKDYHNCLIDIYHLQKQKIIAHRKGQPKEKIQKVQSQLNEKLQIAQETFRTFRNASNKLDFAFVTFTTQAKRDIFLQKHAHGLLGRLFYKFCTCCSSTAIHGRHINVQIAPQPEDIDWLNLEERYWTKKIHRMACFYMCFAILIYGVLFQYEISIMQYSNFSVSIIKTGVIFVANYLIITLLESTTYQIQKHQLNTNKMLSLIKKLTFFIFINLSMSPLALYLYYQFFGKEQGKTTAFDNLAFSVLTISLGNIFKPLAEYLNFQRILRIVKFYYQRSRGMKCQMTQEQANKAFESIPFPLAAFYSLFISSLLMTSFFVSSFQLLIIIELISCLVLYIVSKYMLLKVCKEPTGLKNQISILCQRLLTTSIYVYWIGDKIMHYCIVEQKTKTFLQYIEDFTPFDIVELAIIGFITIFSSKLLSIFSHEVAETEDIKQSLLQQVNKNVNLINSYEEVNAIKKLQESYKQILNAY